MAGNPLRPAPRPFMRRPVKSERPRGIPPAQNQPVDNPDEWSEYTLKACTQEDLDQLRFHVLKFQSKQPVDPKTFHQPIRMHRKETKNLQYHLTRAEIEQRQRENAEQKREAEEEARKQMEAKEQAIRDGLILPKFDIANDPNVAPEPPKSEEEKKLEKMAKQQQNIAPDGGARRKINPQKRKTRKLQALDENTKKLRYEEYYPWVMEDYDGTNTWAGQYDASGADQLCLMYLKGNEFIMVPSDKVYKFTPRNRYATLTVEEAEARLQKHNTVPRWLMKHLDESEQKLTRAERTKKKLKTVEGGEQKESRGSDHDDLDFDEEFADDEEAPIMEGNDEENKESEKRIKREMLNANAMGLYDDENGDDDVDDLFETRKVDKDGERVRKTLIKTEVGGMYDSDDDVNPYLSESDLADPSEDELLTADLSKPQSPSGTSLSRQGSPSIRSIRVKSHNQGYVVFKAFPSVLKQFPAGDWNPNVKKRVAEPSSEDEDRDSKRVKIESTEDNDDFIKVEENPIIPGSKEDILTAEDVLNVVKEGGINAKMLLKHLKSKLANPDNKARVKQLVRTLLKNENGILVPRNPAA